MALPYRTTGSRYPAFAPARLVSLAVKHPYAIALSVRFPTVPRIPSSSSVTLWEETAPVKLPTMHGPRSGLRTKVRTSNTPGWYFKDGSTMTSVTASLPPTYPTLLSLHDALPIYCPKFPTAASRRSLGRVSVPVWRIILSDQLMIVALVSRYLTNQLIIRMPICKP